mmetsp:Transcript_52357/g.125675  ORF Transcript_52357/g.125675 Transcript_52357/m.125675 type:complete len:213 (-) Transcript_52357:1408-2046(-)
MQRISVRSTIAWISSLVSFLEISPWVNRRPFSIESSSFHLILDLVSSSFRITSSSGLHSCSALICVPVLRSRLNKKTTVPCSMSARLTTPHFRISLRSSPAAARSRLSNTKTTPAFSTPWRVWKISAAPVVLLPGRSRMPVPPSSAAEGSKACIFLMASICSVSWLLADTISPSRARSMLGSPVPITTSKDRFITRSFRTVQISTASLFSGS